MSFKWLIRLIVLMTGLLAGSVYAHPMPQSFVAVRVLHHGWHLHLRLPADRLEVALVQAGLVPDPGPGNNTRPTLRVDQVRAYVADRIKIHSLAGGAWTTHVTAVQPPLGNKVDEWQVDVDAAPPHGDIPRTALLNYEVIVREIATHSAVVTVTDDWYRGVQLPAPRLVGALRADVRTLRIDRTPGGQFSGLGDIFTLGLNHIAEGTDHLLFLLALLLPAPLVAAAGRWTAYGGAGHTFRRLFHIVTAFTIGHSLTLVLGAFGGWSLPQKPIEILIALSIFVSAIHAWRPVFRGREAWIAAGFGLVHGLSFATVIASAGIDVWQKASAVLAFNLGIEAMQLIVVIMVVPWLILLARADLYRGLRLAGAGLAAVASIAWVLERVSGHPNPVSTLVSGLLNHAPWGIGLLAVTAIVVTVWRRDVLTLRSTLARRAAD